MTLARPCTSFTVLSLYCLVFGGASAAGVAQGSLYTGKTGVGTGYGPAGSLAGLIMDDVVWVESDVEARLRSGIRREVGILTAVAAALLARCDMLRYGM
jgi:hypothetical protein